MRHIIFPAYPNLPEQLNPYFKREAEAAQAAGFGISLVSDENTPGPILVSNKTADSYIYRGWIVKPAYYQEMCQVVGKPLLNSYQNYMSSYELPRWYSQFTPEDTAQSLIMDAEEIVKRGLEGVAQEVVRYFECSEPLMLKDFLKSLKHEWYDACYIKDASDTQEILRIMTNFFHLRGRDFVGGLVFRKFLNLKRAGVHPKTGTPVPVEYRVFFVHGKPFATVPIWEQDGADYSSDKVGPSQDRLDYIGQKLLSPFVGLDFAKDADSDKWWMIEVNDGGAAGCPEHMDFHHFYRELYNRA